MRRRFLFLMFMVTVLLYVLSATPYEAQEGAADKAKGQDSIPDLKKIKMPENKRSELQVPDALWKYVSERVGYKDKTLGYTKEEMRRYKFSKHILPFIANLFRDVKSVPRVSGAIGDMFLAREYSPAGIVNISYTLLGQRGGRSVGEPKKKSWGVKWLPDETKPVDALAIVINKHDGKKKKRFKISKKDMKNWRILPEAMQRLTIRLMIAAVEASPWIREAFDEEFLVKKIGVKKNKITPDLLFKFVSAPWNDFKPCKAAFDSLDKVDLAYLAFGSTIYLAHVQKAVKEYRAFLAENKKAIQLNGFEGCRFKTAIGTVRIYGDGNDDISDEDNIIIDLGGDDNYSGRKGVPLSLDKPVSIVVDLDGNDSYDGGKKPANLACGLFGVGAIVDLKGNDKYKCFKSGIGSAWYGTGLVWDIEGSDKYTVEGGDGQGSAHVGVGLLMDNEGNDTYFCGTEAQGFGSTLGVGAIVDFKGNDSYRASDTYRISKPFNSKPISFAQGTGFGRRADSSDGHSLGGGVGILIEGDGDDTYYGNIYSQGAGYWWAFGICEDRGGNDTYRCIWYSLGSAPHFAIGSMVDLKGNDKYNVGNEESVLQFQGCARDASIAVFIDGEGDDHYVMNYRCAGAGDMNSIALFWDRTGNDLYETNLDRKRKDEQPFGSAVVYKGMRGKTKTVGIFLDTFGKDRYVIDKNRKGKLPLAKDNSMWQHNKGPIFYGIGLDFDLYEK